MIERRILIGLIVSSEYLQQVRAILHLKYFSSSMTKRLISWCYDYFDRYNKAPNKDIEAIFRQKASQGLPKDLVEEIEEDILPDLSEEYEREGINIPYLIDQTHAFIKERNLILLDQEVKGLLSEGKVTEAEQSVLNYTSFVQDAGTGLMMSDPIVLDRIDKAFSENVEPLIKYPKQMGAFINSQLIRDAFVAFMSTEKRGKSYLLMDLAMRACRQGRSVAFFQAGDMSEGQQLRRMAIHLARKSDTEKFTGEMWEPVRDCVKNQLDTCDKKEREVDFGVFPEFDEKKLKAVLSLDDLKDAFEEYPEYKPCTNCLEYQSQKWGVPWISKVNVGKPLQKNEAKDAVEKFFIKSKRNFMLSTHANDTLSVAQIKALLTTWEKQYNFVPDIIIVDYADILVPDKSMEFRHAQNSVWKSLRGLSQEKHCLVVTVTQADADSYERDLLRLKNFSEDKRKYAHVTAMYGLNQDTAGREKSVGVMRINELVIREGDFNNTHFVYILQNLKRGLPILSSFF